MGSNHRKLLWLTFYRKRNSLALCDKWLCFHYYSITKAFCIYFLVWYKRLDQLSICKQLTISGIALNKTSHLETWNYMFLDLFIKFVDIIHFTCFLREFLSIHISLLISQRATNYFSLFIWQLDDLFVFTIKPFIILTRRILFYWKHEVNFPVQRKTLIQISYFQWC